MHVDVADLLEFYGEPTGAMVRRLLRLRLRAHWSDVTGKRILGYGYAAPYLGAFKETARAVIAAMPAEQGVTPWPRTPPYATVLTEQYRLPLPDACLDGIIAVHALEMVDRPHELLREFWRLLAPEGRMLLVVPNRSGFWASFDSTPFGHGKPYSRGQVDRLLRGALFEPTSVSGALSVPPVRWALVRRSALTWERMGQRFWPAFAGVLVVEAQKQVAAPIRGAPATVGVRRTVGVRSAQIARRAITTRSGLAPGGKSPTHS